MYAGNGMVMVCLAGWHGTGLGGKVLLMSLGSQTLLGDGLCGAKVYGSRFRIGVGKVSAGAGREVEDCNRGPGVRDKWRRARL